MADSGSMSQQVTEEIAETANEVVKDVKDAFGEMIEQGVQTATGSQLTPQQIQQQQQEDQKKEADRQNRLAYTRQWFKNLEYSQNKVIAENKQKEQQRLQAQQQEDQTAEIKKEEKKKQPINPAIAYAGKVEFKRGVGG